jgi:Cu+-exporting ATPase
MNMRTRDPVCGGSVESTFSVRRHHHGGFEYYFCSDACMTRFLENPGQYAGSSKGS